MAAFDFPISQIKAMVVDDHDPIRKAMRRVLVDLGIANVIECFDGGEAIKAFEKDSDINLVLCDIYMRKIDGFAVLAHIRSRNVAPDIPFIVVTGEAHKEDIVKAADLGGNDYLVKPFQAEVLATKVKTVLSAFFNPTPFIKHLREGDRLLLMQKPGEALLCYEEALKLDGKDKRANHTYGLALFHAKRLDEALTVLKRNTLRFPSYYRNYATMANIYLFQKKTKKAIKALEKELELNPKQAMRQVQLGKIYLKLSDYENSLLHFREALKDNPKHKMALYGMGKALAKSQEFEKALYYFKRMRRHYPKDPKALDAIFTLGKDFGQLKKVESFLLDEKNLHPDRLDTYLYLGRYYYQAGELGKAKNAGLALLKVDPENKSGHEFLGKLALAQKEYSEAYHYFEKSAQGEASPEALYFMAESKIGEKEVPAAILLLQRSLFLSPYNFKSLSLLGKCFQMQGEVVKAMIMYTLAGEAEGASPQIKAKVEGLRSKRRPMRNLEFRKAQ